ncbi:hypothetical protein C8R45DRAFT_183676 [Mycena sanguinolenta]|nr:hypothetical protein C8R45DRAFT_183676 [Mycena sanguinolenta]
MSSMTLDMQVLPALILMFIFMTTTVMMRNIFQNRPRPRRHLPPNLHRPVNSSLHATTDNRLVLVLMLPRCRSHAVKGQVDLVRREMFGPSSTRRNRSQHKKESAYFASNGAQRTRMLAPRSLRSPPALVFCESISMSTILCLGRGLRSAEDLNHSKRSHPACRTVSHPEESEDWRYIDSGTRAEVYPIFARGIC